MSSTDSPPAPIALRQLRKRPVVDTGTAATIGRVRAVRINATRATVVGFVIRGGEGEFVPLGTVQGIGKDAVTVPSASVLTEDDELLPADTDAYGSRVLDEDGNELGKLTDLHIAEDGRITAVVIDGTTTDRPLMGIGSYAVVVGRAPGAVAPTSEVGDDGREDLVDGPGI